MFDAFKFLAVLEQIASSVPALIEAIVGLVSATQAHTSALNNHAAAIQSVKTSGAVVTFPTAAPATPGASTPVAAPSSETPPDGGAGDAAPTHPLRQ